ncbi:MAG: PD40 domain-containing protein, partial [Gemmatimonadetes bacterium]|nr:PD40 domain-containing protein [Gemmatimonadota bacterium]
MKKFILLALLLICPGVARPQDVPPQWRWHTFETVHFRVTFAPGLEELARHAAGRAEAAYQVLSQELLHAPRGTIDLLVTDHTDFSNGFATPLPSNRIVVYAAPPVDDPALAFHNDWLELVLVHELTHILHLDHVAGLGAALRALFGRVPAPWPFFPALATPTWSIEGLATYYESRVTGAGRVNGSYHDMVLRTAVLEGAFDGIDRASGSSPVWPGGQRPYVYGSLFLDYLAGTHGPEVHQKLVQRAAGALIPPPLAFDRVARRATGRSFSASWRAWRALLEERYNRLADSLRAHGLTPSERLAGGGRYTLHPRFAPDSRQLAFVAENGRDDPATIVLDAATGQRRRLARRNGFASELGPASWLPDGETLVTAQFEIARTYELYSDLYLLGPGGGRRLTRGLRLAEPDVAPDGRRVAAVQSHRGRTRPVVYDIVSGTVQPLREYAEGENWSLPRWSPGGTRVAIGRWRSGGEYDVVLLDTLGALLRELTHDRAIDAAPAWSPDGRYLLFSSDRSGIPNLFAAAVDQTPAPEQPAGAPGAEPPLYQVSNVLTGAFYAEVSRDGRWIYFVGYHADGFHLERMPFDPASWREPAPLRPALALREKAVTAQSEKEAAAPEEAAASEAAGVSRPATPPPPEPSPRPYTPWPTLLPRFWLPLYSQEPALGGVYGALTAGQDLVQRHTYTLWAALAPREDRLEGGLAYQYSGFGNPLLALEVSRTWSGRLRSLPDTSTARQLRSEDEASLSARFLRRRWRSSTSLTVAAERVTERDLLLGTSRYRLADPRDDLAGIAARLAYATARSHAFSISREDGISLALGGRRRWDLEPSATHDRSYS